MSQLASFTFIKESDLPFLGFWSKPKSRLLRRPEQRFDQYLAARSLREYICDTDGFYVALCFVWIEHENPAFTRNQDPVAGTLIKNLGGAHWLLRADDRKFLVSIATPIASTEWEAIIPVIAKDHYDGLNPDIFEKARAFTAARCAELHNDEALLVSIG